MHTVSRMPVQLMISGCIALTMLECNLAFETAPFSTNPGAKLTVEQSRKRCRRGRCYMSPAPLSWVDKFGKTIFPISTEGDHRMPLDGRSLSTPRSWQTFLPRYIATTQHGDDVNVD